MSSKKIRVNKQQISSKKSKIKAEENNIKPPTFQHPIFCFKYLCNKDYSLEDCIPNDLIAFTKTLYKLSQLTWSQIQTSGRHGCGHEIIQRDQIKKEIHLDLVEINQ